ncbi:DUF6617 family protein [Kordia algicida OT-1]|uniref:Uncharacterized protein n=1 Tax=Kordia algicida OT-1 TaxID=391587 RepID=A9DR49_9FLAO|nr:DUF6617 family protein [Kordia algicida]EDP96740.1 hypothetical protein KAOT1_16293 [Kordia algicida OT-1]
MQNKQLLSFYYDLLFTYGIASIRDSFIGNETIKNKGYSFIQEHDYHMKDEMVEDDDLMPTFVTDIIKREDFLNRLMQFENSSINSELETQLNSKGLKKEKLNLLNQFFDDLKVLLKRIDNIEDRDSEAIRTSLLEITSKVKQRYQLIVSNHDVFKYLVKDSDITFFKNKNLKYSFYQELYELAYSLYLIDDIEIEESHFVEAFISPKPSTLINKIRFSANNMIASYFLESLKPFFNGFNHITIEASEIFLNKQGKVLKSTDIYASLSRGKNKYLNEKKKIDSGISELKKKHLK